MALEERLHREVRQATVADPSIDPDTGRGLGASDGAETGVRSAFTREALKKLAAIAIAFDISVDVVIAFRNHSFLRLMLTTTR